MIRLKRSLNMSVQTPVRSKIPINGNTSFIYKIYIVSMKIILSPNFVDSLKFVNYDQLNRAKQLQFFD